MFTYTVTQSVTPASGILSSAKSYVSGYTQELKDEPVADGATDLAINFAFLVASVQVFYMVSTVDLVVKSNDSGAPANTINLVATVPYLWTIDDYNTFLFTTDVTGLFVTNGTAGTDGVFNIRALSDATP